MTLRQHLEEQIAEDLKLLKELERKLRFEDNPRRYGEWETSIKEVKQRIHQREEERKSLLASSAQPEPVTLESEQKSSTSSPPAEIPLSPIQNLAPTTIDIQLSTVARRSLLLVSTVLGLVLIGSDVALTLLLGNGIVLLGILLDKKSRAQNWFYKLISMIASVGIVLGVLIMWGTIFSAWYQYTWYDYKSWYLYFKKDMVGSYLFGLTIYLTSIYLGRW